MASTINALTTGVGGIQSTGDTSGEISLQSNGSTVLAMTASGVAVTGTMTVGGNAVLKAGTTVTTAQGGTGLTSFTSGGAMYATSTSALTTGILPVASGGTGTATPSLVGGTNITISGSWPNQTVTAAGGAPTTGQVQSAMAGSNVGELGTFGLFWYSGTANPGTTSSSVSYSNCAGDTNGSPSGTWRCMAYSFGGGGAKQVTVWLRIS